MRVAYSGDIEEAKQYLGEARQELQRLKLRMTVRGETHGRFGPVQLSPTVWVSGYVLPTGLEKIFVEATPQFVDVSVPVKKEDLPVAQTYFEFVTNGFPVEFQTITLPTGDFKQFKAAVVGTTVSLRDDKLYLNPVIGKGAKAYDTSPNSPLRRYTQITLFDEPVAYPTTGLGTALYESYASLSPHTGAWLRSIVTVFPRLIPPTRGDMSSWTIRDVDFDIPFQYGIHKQAVKRAYMRDGTDDWPRANAVLTVPHSTGARVYGVYNDSAGNFFFFPLNKIGPPGLPYSQNVPSIYVKSIKPTLPAWVWSAGASAHDQFAANGAKATVDFQDIDWKFSHNGDKACAVVFERQLAEFDDVYWSTDVGLQPIYEAEFDAKAFYSGVMSKNDATYAASHNPLRYHMAPGLLEIAFTLTITGPNAEDFTVDAVVNEIRRPTTSPYFTVLAGYCWHDIKAVDWTEQNQHFDAKRGDMVTLDLELQNNYTYDAPSENTLTRSIVFHSLKNLTQFNKELRTFLPWADSGNPDYSGVPAVFRNLDATLIDFDLTTLSFVFMHKYCTAKSMPGAPAPSWGVRVDTRFSMNVFTFNRFSEALYPQTIDDAAREILETYKEFGGRQLVTEATRPYTLFPLNKMDTWTSNAEYGKLRYYHAGYAKAYVEGVPRPKANAATYNDFQMAYVNLQGVEGDIHLQTTVPCIGWLAYANWHCLRYGCNEHSTFFTHPNGSWAFHDQQHVYNKNGVYAVYTPTNTLPLVDTAKFEHVIFDRIHLQLRDKVATTTFVDLYNRAVYNGQVTDTLVDDLQPITPADLRATFTITPYTFDVPHAGVVGSILMAWGGASGYIVDWGYVNQAGAASAIRIDDEGSAVQPNMGQLFSVSPAGMGTTADSVTILAPRANNIRFSSCVLVT